MVLRWPVYIFHIDRYNELVCHEICDPNPLSRPNFDRNTPFRGYCLQGSFRHNRTRRKGDGILFRCKMWLRIDVIVGSDAFHQLSANKKKENKNPETVDKNYSIRSVNPIFRKFSKLVPTNGILTATLFPLWNQFIISLNVSVVALTSTPITATKVFFLN